MPNNNYQGGYAPQAGGASTVKEKINVWEGIGIVNARGRNQEIRFFEFANGGGAIHFTLICTEFTGKSDQNGNPRKKTCYVPVNIMTNRTITAQQLRAIVPGMKVRVVGRLGIESYDDKQTGQKRSTLVVDAFVLEIKEMPMQAPQYGGYSQAAAPQYQPQNNAPQYQQPAPQAPQYPGQQYPQPVAPQYQPQNGVPQYQQPAAPPQVPQYPGQQYPQGGGAIPPYYQPGQQLPPEGDLPN